MSTASVLKKFNAELKQNKKKVTTPQKLNNITGAGAAKKRDKMVARATRRMG